jgi:hypothetical protein
VWSAVEECAVSGDEGLEPFLERARAAVTHLVEVR